MLILTLINIFLKEKKKEKKVASITRNALWSKMNIECTIALFIN